MNYLQEKWNSYNASQFIQYLRQIDANLTAVYNLLQLVDGNVSKIYDLLEMVDINVTNIDNTLNAVYSLLKQVNSNLTYVNLTLQDAYNLLKQVDMNVTTVYNLLVLTDGNVTKTYNLLKSMDGNVTAIYQLLQLVDNNITTVYNLLLKVSSNTTDINETVNAIHQLLQTVNNNLTNVNLTLNDAYKLLQLVDNNVSAVYDLLVLVDGNVTATYNLLQIVDGEVDVIFDIVDYINSTRWNNLTAWDLYQAINNITVNATVNNTEVLEILKYINNTRWHNLTAWDLYQAIRNINASSKAFVVANFTYFILANNFVQFIDDSFSTIPIENYTWNISGKIYYTENPKVQLQPGIYNVTLTITDKYGNTDTIAKTVVAKTKAFTPYHFVILFACFALLTLVGSMTFYRFGSRENDIERQKELNIKAILLGTIALFTWLITSAISIMIGVPYEIVINNVVVSDWNVVTTTSIPIFFLGVAVITIVWVTFLIVQTLKLSAPSSLSRRMFDRIWRKK